MDRRRASSHSPRGAAKAYTRGGFSFTEILFAIMILGIGFIMVAAIFPVAIKQTQATTEETNITHLASAAADAMQKLARDQTVPVVDSTMPTGFLSTDPAPAYPPTVTTSPTAIASRVWSFHDGRFADTNFTIYNNPANFPAPMTFIGDRMWAAVSGNLILPTDTRYAWIPLYRRDMVLKPGFDPSLLNLPYTSYQPSAYAQLILIGVEVRNHSRYDPHSDLQQYTNNPEATLEPHLVPTVQILGPTAGGQSAAQPGSIKFNLASGTDADRLGEGAFVVIADDRQTPTDASNSVNGFVLRLGTFRPDLSSGLVQPAYELMAGFSLPANSRFAGPGPLVFVVGRGCTDPRNFNAGFSGPVQDIAVYKSFVKVQ